MADTEGKPITIGFQSRGSTASLKLRASQPDGTSSELFLVDGLTIGRTSANSMQALDDEKGNVERNHARVDFDDNGAAVLRCLNASVGIETKSGKMSTLALEAGTTFRIGKTAFEVMAGPADEDVSLTVMDRGCPYCGHADLPAERGVTTGCSKCGRPVVVVPLEQNFGVPTFLPGVFHDEHAAEFSVRRFVARGGMGYVLEAASADGQVVAIKVLVFDGRTNADAVSRFRQEIDLLRRVQHPNVLRLIAHGQEAGLFFFVMEWVDGGDLRSKLPAPGDSSKLIEFAKARLWFAQACEGLAAIHDAGAVHRDIKPSNLLLTKDGRLLVADLGVAKRLNDGETGMTRTGQMPGTYWYMAPEQENAPDLVDKRTDIYSLAFTFWELLTGVKPKFMGAARPSDVNPTVPPEFDRVLLAMLAPTMQDRPASLLDVLRSLPKAILTPDTSGGLRPAPAAAPASPSPATVCSTLRDSSTETVNSASAASGSPTPSPPASPTVSKTSGRHDDALDRLADAIRKAITLARTAINRVRPLLSQLVSSARRLVAELWESWRAKTQTPSPSHDPFAPGTSRAPSPPADQPIVATAPHPVQSSLPVLSVATRDSTGTACPKEESIEVCETTVARDQESDDQRTSVETARNAFREQQLAALRLPNGTDQSIQALKAAHRSLMLLPPAVRTPEFVSEVGPEIENRLTAVLRTRGDHAFSAKEYGTALAEYQELRRLSLADALVTDRIDQILAIRRTALAEAMSSMRQGHLGQVKDRVNELKTDYTGDAMFQAECAQFLNRIRLIEQRVKETVPTLRATRHLFRMSQLLDQLADEQVTISGLDDLREKTRRTLAEASRKLATARQRLAEGHVDLARELIAEVRTKVADHPDADELSGTAEAEKKRQSELTHDVRELIRQGKHLRAHRFLAAERRSLLVAIGLMDDFKLAARHKRRSDRFLRLLAWATAGTACIAIASRAANYVWSGFIAALGSPSAIVDFLNTSLVGWTFRYALFVLLASFALHILRRLIAGAHKRRSLAADLVALVMISVLVSCVEIGRQGLIQWGASLSVAQQQAIVVSACWWMFAAAIALMHAVACITFCRIGTDIVAPQANVPIRPAILLAAIPSLTFMVTNASSLVYCGVETSSAILLIVPSVLLAIAAAATVAPVRRAGVFGWPIVAAAIAFLAFRIFGLHDFSGWSTGALLWSIVLSGSVFLAMAQRTRRAISWAGIIGCSAVVVTQRSVSSDGLLDFIFYMLPWAAACAVVPWNIRDHIIHHFEVRERSAEAWRWLKRPAEQGDAFERDSEKGEDFDAADKVTVRPVSPQIAAVASPRPLPSMPPPLPMHEHRPSAQPADRPLQDRTPPTTSRRSRRP